MNNKSMKRYISLIVILTIFLTTFTACSGSRKDGEFVMGGHSLIGETSKKETTEEESEEPEEPEETETEKTDNEDGLYIVEAMDTSAETITLLSLASGTMLRYNYSLTTTFLDEFGNHTSWSNFTPGQVVEIGDRLSSGALSSVSFSDEVWREDSVKDYKIDTSLMMMKIGSAKYHIPENVAVFSNDVVSALEGIGTNDVLRVIGKEKKILSVCVITGHGYIQILNAGIFDGSLLMVGKKIVTTVYENQIIEVPEGEYAITAASKGYGDTKNYVVQRNLTTFVDMNEMLGEGPKTCELTFKIGVPGAQIYVDGTLMEADVPHSVTYGAHKLMVSAEGYDTWNKTLVVNSPTAEIELSMTESDSESSSGSSSGSSTGSTGNTSTDANGENTNSENTDNSGNNGNTTNSSTTNSSTSSGTNSSGSSSSSSSSGTGTNSSSGSSQMSDRAQSEVDYLTTMSSILSKLFDSD